VARFADKIGFAFTSVETRPGVFKDVITEKPYFGDVRRAARQALTTDKINDDLVAENVIEIVADAYANDNMFAIRYVWWTGKRWKVLNVEQSGVRLILRLGGIYNGPTANISS